MTLQIAPVENAKALKAFIRFPYSIYMGDPHWVPPLEFERRQFLNRKKNPFFRHGEAQLFLALRDGKPVGRISAQIYKPHLERHRDATGFFGFFETAKDANIAGLLVEAAQDWLKGRGMKSIRGPFSFTMNDEIGVLIDGFHTPPTLLMNHNPPYYATLLEGAGFKKIKDVYAYHYTIGGLSEQAMQLAEATRQHPGLELRPFDRKHYRQEIQKVIAIFNEAWAQNWGFTPITKEEAIHMAESLKAIMDPEMAFFATVNGDLAAMSICLPNVNEAIHDLKGRLFPFGWAKLLWRLKKGLKSTRLCLMGIRKPYRGSALGALSVLMNVEMHRRGKLHGYETSELSWTLEDNEKINKGIEFMGGRRYKTYRIYEKGL